MPLRLHSTLNSQTRCVLLEELTRRRCNLLADEVHRDLKFSARVLELERTALVLGLTVVAAQDDVPDTWGIHEVRKRVLSTSFIYAAVRDWAPNDALVGES